MKKLIALIMIIGMNFAYADNVWKEIAKNPDYILYVKIGSLTQDDANASILTKRMNRKTTNTEYFRNILSKQACKNGFGSLGITTVDYSYKNASHYQYVMDGTDGVAAIGDEICYLLSKK